MTAYLDNSATTKPSKACVDAINKMLTESWGNPSSLHALGVSSAKEIILARSAVAESLGAEKEEIYFTSGGTEANNLALFGAVKAKKRLGNRIVTTAIEHESVLQSAQELEKQGFEVIYIQPDKYGFISEEQIKEAVVCCQYASPKKLSMTKRFLFQSCISTTRQVLLCLLKKSGVLSQKQAVLH